MSIVNCEKCSFQIDTDNDTDCYIDSKFLCESCRKTDKWCQYVAMCEEQYNDGEIGIYLAGGLGMIDFIQENKDYEVWVQDDKMTFLLKDEHELFVDFCCCKDGCGFDITKKDIIDSIKYANENPTTKKYGSLKDEIGFFQSIIDELNKIKD